VQLITGTGAALATGTALGQQNLTPTGGPRPTNGTRTASASSAPALDRTQNPKIARLKGFDKLLPEFQQILLEKGDASKSELYRGPIASLNTECQIVTLKGGRGMDDSIAVIPKGISEQNLLGTPSGFDYRVPEDFVGYQLQPSTLKNEDEKKSIEIINEILRETIYVARHYPFCVDKADLADGKKTSGRIMRELQLTFPSNNGAVSKLDAVLKKNDIPLSDAQRPFYEEFGLLRSTEEAGKAGLTIESPSMCNSPVVGRAGGIGMIVSGLKEYPTRGGGYLATDTIYQILLTYSRGQRCAILQQRIKTLNEIISGKNTRFGTFSPDGKKALMTMKHYYSKEEQSLAKLDLASAAFKPKGVGEALPRGE